MTWLPDVLGFGIFALCCVAFWLCRRERKTIKQMIDDVVGRPR